MTPSTPSSDANSTIASHRADGMPRSRQQLTVEGLTPSLAATNFVPPSASMSESDVIMSGTLVCTMQTRQAFATRKTTRSAENVDIGGMIDPPEIIGQRLERLRVELGFAKQQDFANALGIDKSTYSLYKNGSRALTFETACIIRQKWGISLDWLFFGDMQQAAIQTMAKIGRGTEDTHAARTRKKVAR
nr:MULTISPECIES: helix-turn-helix transcriptional regulator [unclassified Bradyrhizobium]